MNTNTNYHVPILKDEIIHCLIRNKNGVYFDGTLGGGGHSEAILQNINKEGKLISFDRDLESISFASNRLKEFNNFFQIHENFHNAKTVLKSINITNIDGAILDLGVSSHQLDSQTRGFSYHINANLDMRMDTSTGITAKEYLNTIDKQQFISDLYNYADERWANRIAEKLILFRNEKTISTSFDLVQIVDSAIPKKLRNQMQGHPAKRVFQAVRIAINDELNPLSDAISDIISILNNNSRLCVLTFHSIEDRIVKHIFKTMESPCTCSPKAPICTCNKVSFGKIITKKPILASEDEIKNNSRSHSAKLRVFERIF